jgi:hypothetical protein
MSYINIPRDCIEANLPICPECHDTKYITADKCIKLCNPPRQTLTCSKCKISWDMTYTSIVR